MRLIWTSLLWVLGVSAVAVEREQAVFDVGKNHSRPVVIWHGLGDTAHSAGIDQFADSIRELYPGIFVHSVQIPTEGTPSDDQKAGWWGNAVEQAAEACEQINAIPELAEGFDAIGFSQGGLFLRWYAQYCDGPRVRNLLTFGTPHYGIAALIPCPTPATISCILAARAAKAGIYTAWAQRNLVQAQYYRDPARMEEFLQVNTFLRDLNAENGEEDDDEKPGGRGLAKLENIVAIAFDEDHTVVPGLSAHWATLSPDNVTEIIPLHDQPLYKEDWIGLRKLEKRGGLHLAHCPGQHMEIGGEGECGDKMVRKWIGWAA